MTLGISWPRPLGASWRALGDAFEVVGLSGGGLGSQKGLERLQEDLRRLPGGQKCNIFTWVLFRLPFLSLSSRENASY